MFITALFTITKTRKLSKCPSNGKWIKVLYLCNSIQQLKEWTTDNMQQPESSSKTLSSVKEARQKGYTLCNSIFMTGLERHIYRDKTDQWLPGTGSRNRN